MSNGSADIKHIAKRSSTAPFQAKVFPLFPFGYLQFQTPKCQHRTRAYRNAMRFWQPALLSASILHILDSA